MTQLTLYVDGISYVDHLHAIEQCIKKLRGIESVKWTMPKGKITVKFKQSYVSTLDIIGRIEEHGVEVVKKIQKDYRMNAFN